MARKVIRLETANSKGVFEEAIRQLMQDLSCEMETALLKSESIIPKRVVVFIEIER